MLLVYERIREEVRGGRSMLSSLRRGSTAPLARSSTARDELVAGILLYWLGSGTIKGFAVTLSIGVPDLAVFRDPGHPIVDRDLGGASSSQRRSRCEFSSAEVAYMKGR